MQCAKSNRRLCLVLTALAVLSVAICDKTAHAQEPPLTIPSGAPPPADPNAIKFHDWFLYPSVDVSALNSNNYLLTPTGKLAGWAFGVSPAITAEWSNGIHSTTLFGSYDHVQYLSNEAATTDDGEATLTQRYAPLRDLNFTFLGDYTHHTFALNLINAIPSPTVTTATVSLPSGNLVLPNGVIVSPSGQIVGQNVPAPTTSASSIVNPYDSFTGTAKVQKYLGDGVWTLGASIQRTDYEQQASALEDFTASTFSEDGTFWVGPMFYLYSNGAFSLHEGTGPNADSNAYRVIGGIGTREIGLFRAALYFGYQGSETSGSSPAGGDVFGGSLGYDPMPSLTIRGTVDVTINKAAETVAPSMLALNIPVPSPLQVPITSSSKTFAAALTPEYKIAPQWSLTGLFGYQRVEFEGSSELSEAWVGDATLRFDIRRDLTLSWEYQYSSIVSNQPQSSAVRNLFVMHGAYKF